MCGMTNAEKIFSVNGRISDFFIDISLRSVVLLVVRRTTTTTRTEGFIMTKRKIGLAIGLAVTCIAALCATGACNGIGKEEKAVRRVIVTTLATTSQATEPVSSTTQPTSTAPVTTTVIATTEETTAATTVPHQITTVATCSTTEQGLGETPTPTTTTEQTVITDTTVQPTTTAAPVTTTAPTYAQPYNGQTSGDYIYCIGFGWVFNEGGGGYGETNYDMYCNGNKIGYFG